MIYLGLPAAVVVNYVPVLAPDSLSLAGFKTIHQLSSVKQAGLTKPANLSDTLKSLKLFDNPSNLYIWAHPYFYSYIQLFKYSSFR